MTDARGARVLRLIQDPELGGDLLLLGLGMCAVYDFGLTYQQFSIDLGNMLWAGRRDPHWKVHHVFKLDSRTYRVLWPDIRHCTAPMRRRDGACGKSASNMAMLTDWATGEKTCIGGCSRHADWFNRAHRANLQSKPDIVPLPHANHGGILAKHFPRIDWPRFWKNLDPTWVQHPERTEWPKPDLTLVLGKGLDDRRQGSLTLVPSGGEW